MRSLLCAILTLAASLVAQQSQHRATWYSLNDLHADFETRFIASPGMGLSRMPSERLRLDPRQILDLSGEDGSDTWTVSTLDLIGVAKHQQPVVYSRTSHGSYAQAHRGLTDFEQHALSTLRRGGNIATRSENGSMILVGAIRARSACLACHKDTQLGDLLGAIRYTLQRAPALSKE